MAKRVKKEDQEPGDGHGVSAFRGNGYDPQILGGFNTRIANLYGDLATEKGESMARCRAIHQDIDAVLKEAKNAGIPKKEFKAVIKKRTLLAKAEEIRADLEGDSVETFDQIEFALGKFAETDLGAAALNAAA
jgi:uncharacterized protein (UPF0335 family)